MKIIVVIFIILAFLLAQKHWERRCEDTCFTLGDIRWEMGQFPNHYSLKIEIKENVR